MKSNIHPQWYQAEVICACGNMFTVGSTKPKIRVEICHKCHPFFTGEMKYVDTMGRVERFQKKQEKAKAVAQTLIEKKMKKKQKAESVEHQPKSLREMLLGTS